MSDKWLASERPFRVFPRRWLAGYVLLCMCLWSPPKAVLAADEQEREIEEVQVLGEQSQVALSKSIREAEVHLYELFNDLNSTDAYDVTCRFHDVTGSRVPVWRCEIGFMALAGYRNSQDFLQFCFNLEANSGDGHNTMELPATCILPKTAEQVFQDNRHILADMNAEMLALAQENPELAQAMLDLYAKRQRMQELQLKQRDSNGGFFRRLFGRKKE